MIDVIAMGRATVDLYANELGRPLSQVETFSRYVGGCPANFAVGVARLGAKTSFIGRVGDDEMGRFVRNFLESEGIDISHISSDPHYRTGLNLVSITPPDKFPILYYRQPCADEYLTKEELEPEHIASARLLFTSGVSMATAPSREATLRAQELAREAGVRVVFDVDYRPMVWPDSLVASFYEKMALTRADVIIGTEEEISIIAPGEGPRAMAEAILRQGPGLVVVKRGGLGSSAFTGDEEVHAPGFPVEILNTLGAGDGFGAGFCFGLLQGWSLEQCCRFGNAVGGIVVTRHSCSLAMPRRAEVEEFIAKHSS